MEAITLGGLAIVLFGLWIEFEPQLLKCYKFSSCLIRTISAWLSDTSIQPATADMRFNYCYNSKYKAATTRG